MDSAAFYPCFSGVASEDLMNEMDATSRFDRPASKKIIESVVLHWVSLLLFLQTNVGGCFLFVRSPDIAGIV